MYKKVIPIIAFSAIISGCAMTPPANYNVRNAVTYQKSYDVVWERIVSVFARNNVAIKNIAKDSGVIFAERSAFNDDQADCGKPGMFIPVARRMQLNVFVNRSGKDPVVSINTEFIEMRRFMDAPLIATTCTSRGVIENIIFTEIDKP
jgi:hypothetical protein